MEDRDLLKKIEQSAQDLRVPNALEPEQVKEQLKNKNRRIQKSRRYRMIAAAACLCLCFGAGSAAYQNDTRQANYSQPLEKLDEKEENAAENQPAPGESTAGLDLAEEAPVKKLGKMYTLASNYGEVYDVLEKEAERQMAQKERFVQEGIAMDDAKEAEGAEELDVLDSAAMVQENSKMKDIAGAMPQGIRDAEDDAGADFSTTNLQVEGVDESDCVKTDGRFLYVVQDAQIQVLDVRGQIPKKAGTIQPEMDEDTDRICEIYVADGQLTVIVQTEQTSLQQEKERIHADPVEDGRKYEGIAQEDVYSDAQEYDRVRGIADEDVQRIATKAVTRAVTYDISDPQKPMPQDTVTQDGWFQASRKIANRLYLFTGQSLNIAQGMQRGEMLKEEHLDNWLPCVNGSAVRADSIYLHETGSQGILMASIDLASHSKVLDTKLLVNQYAKLYVSSRSAYLYYTEYTNEAERTRIARFALETDGSIRAKAAKTVKGSIQDTFAIHEREGFLQVLTSVTYADPWENRVYVLDENMDTVGKLTGLAKGEQIYAARFTGTVGYFVTYRNTDPLFTVDFSDPSNPKVIGELKVTGFSEYLHFWSGHKLLGIGYETDPDSGRTVGIKLSMFDISNPVKVREEAKLVLEGITECVGLFDYKAVLVDPGKNVIAFTTRSYRDRFEEHYRVFSFENGKFVRRIEDTLHSGEDAPRDSRWRSVFVGDMLYLVNERKVLTYDMADGWKEVDKMKFE